MQLFSESILDPFQRLIQRLSFEDRETRAVEHRRNILKALNLYLNEIEENTPCASFLWLFDRGRDAEFQDCTLWNYHTLNWPIEHTPRQFHGVSRRFRSLTVTKAIDEASKSISIESNLFSKTLLLDKLPGEVRSSLGQAIIPLEPHCEKDREDRFVGFLQIVAPKKALQRIEALHQTIIGKLIFNRIAFGRRQRTIDALRMFQEQIKPEMEYDRIIDAAAACLNKYLTLERICIYDHTGPNGVEKRAQRGPDKLKLPEVSIWVEKFFEAHRLNAPSNCVIRVRDLFERDSDNHLIGPSLSDEQVKPSPPDCSPIAVMLIPVYVGNPDDPPLATIKVICSSMDGFIGGAFSETDEEIGRILSDYLSHLLPGIITYSRTREISRRLDEHDSNALLPGEVHNKIYNVFPEIITKLLVPAKEAWVYACTKEVNGETKVRWISHDGEVKRDPFYLDENTLERATEKPIHLRNVGYLHGISVIESDETLRLYWVSNSPNVPDHDMLIVKQLASDMRLRAFGRLDVQTLSRQIIDIRHALKAAMTGVVGYANLVADTFDDVKDDPLEERDAEIFHRAEFRKAIDSLRMSAETSIRFLDVVRLLKMDLKSGDLKRRISDPNEITKKIIRMLRPYSTRREVRVDIVKSYPASVANPYFDPDLMEIAMSNLVENGIKYARRDTRVQVEIDVIRDEWYFYVQDEGRYIPIEDRERIFQGDRLDVFAGETGQAGTGLGLAAVRRIVKAHDPHGRDEVSSEKTSTGSVQAPTAITRIGFRLKRTNISGEN